METHGSESYYVLGEGLLTRERRRSRSHPRGVRGRGGAAVPLLAHGPAGHGAAARRPGRSSRTAMTAGGGGTGQIPAGYTYLGQFVDHDLTFDKTAVTLGQHVSPGAAAAGALAEPRPRLALRRRPERPGVAAVLRRRPPPEDGQDRGDRPRPGVRGPRPAARRGQHAAQKRRAIIPDPRNDENLAVAQTHLAMIRFHNRIVDTLPASVPAASASPRRASWRSSTTSGCCATTSCRGSARERSSTTCSRTAARRSRSARPDRRADDADRVLGRRFRLGHSMIRRDYNWNKRFPGDGGRRSSSCSTSRHERQPRRLPAAAEQLDRRLPPALRLRRRGGEGEPRRARAASTSRCGSTPSLVNPLRFLPKGSFGGTAADEGTILANLAFRNLTRAKMVRLATGQKMVAFLKGRAST